MAAQSFAHATMLRHQAAKSQQAIGQGGDKANVRLDSNFDLAWYWYCRSHPPSPSVTCFLTLDRAFASTFSRAVPPRPGA